MPLKLKHGTGTAYQTHGCRCEECRIWKSAENRRYSKGFGSGAPTRRSHSCPECRFSYYTAEALKAHQRARHVKE